MTGARPTTSPVIISHNQGMHMLASSRCQKQAKHDRPPVPQSAIKAITTSHIPPPPTPTGAPVSTSAKHGCRLVLTPPRRRLSCTVRRLACKQSPQRLLSTAAALFTPLRAAASDALDLGSGAGGGRLAGDGRDARVGAQ